MGGWVWPVWAQSSYSGRPRAFIETRKNHVTSHADLGSTIWLKIAMGACSLPTAPMLIAKVQQGRARVHGLELLRPRYAATLAKLSTSGEFMKRVVSAFALCLPVLAQSGELLISCIGAESSSCPVALDVTLDR